MKKNILLLLFILCSFLVKAQIDPCSNINTITCGNPITFVSDSVGNPIYRNNTPCFYNLNNSQGGEESIYIFTAPQKGYYELIIDSVNGGNVNYGWKDTSGGCNNSNWNCIDYTNNNGCIGAITLDSGQVIYLLVNAIQANVTHIFRIDCAIDNCSNIPLINCGDTVSFFTSCFGDQDYPNNTPCFYNLNNSQGGQEKIFEFTAPQKGYYQAKLVSAAGGIVNYGWKDKTFGCDAANWQCFNYSNTPGCLGAMTLDSGQSVYIICNAISTAPVNHSFIIECAKNICNSIPQINCSDTITFTSTCYGDENFRNNTPCFYNLNNNQGGQEIIYHLPPSSTGYVIDIISSSGGSVNYGWKYDSLGCDSSNWNCIGIFSSPVSIPVVSADSCKSILLLLNNINSGSTTQTFTINCNNCVTGIYEWGAQKISINPNPTKNYLTIEMTKQNNEQTTVSVVDLLGKKLYYEKFFNQSKLIIDVRDLPSGIYFVQIANEKGEGLVTKKFVKD